MKDKLRSQIDLTLLACHMFGAKVAMSWLPNLHLGTVFLMAAAVRYGKGTFLMAAIYTLLEGLCYGFGLWWISYLYAWPLLVLLALPLKRNPMSLCILGLLFGLCFGALTAIPVAVVSGIPGAIAYWVAGIPYDIAHGAGNFVLCCAFLRPLTKLLLKIDPVPSQD